MSSGETHYMPAKPCKRGHTTLRRTRDGNCQTCNRIGVKKWREKTGYKTNPDYLKEWRKRNADKQAIYDANRPQEKVEQRKAWNAERRKRAQFVGNKQVRDEIRKIYEACRLITKQTGIPHEVDHIHPLRGKNSCGLHVPANLQILTQHKNRSKSNRMEF